MTDPWDEWYIYHYLPTWMVESYGINVGIYTIVPWILWELLLIDMNFRALRKKNNGVPGLLSANPMKFCTLIANPVEKDRHHVVADFFCWLKLVFTSVSKRFHPTWVNASGPLVKNNHEDVVQKRPSCTQNNDSPLDRRMKDWIICSDSRNHFFGGFPSS